MKPKPKRGRPPLEKYDCKKMVAAIEAYLAGCGEELPILKECCLLNGWEYDYVMQLQRKYEELSQSIKKLLAWKEVRLERGGLTGKFDRTMAIFILKQPAHGWTDRQETKISGELELGNPFAGLTTQELRQLVEGEFEPEKE